MEVRQTLFVREDALRIPTYIKSLRLQSAIEAEGAKALAGVLASNSVLVELNLSWSDLCGEDFAVIAKGLHGIHSLKVLKLEQVSLKEDSLKTLVELLNNNKSIQELSVRGNKFGDGLLEAIIRAKSVTRAYLSGSNMFVAAASLKNNGCLRVLDLSENALGSHEAQELAKMLQVDRVLRELTLRQCWLGDTGVAALASGLLHNSALQVLDVSKNDCGREGADRMAAALACNATLVRLDLSHSRIPAAGSKNLAEAMAQNRTLKWLGLSRALGGGAYQWIASIVQTNSTLETLLVDDRLSWEDANMLKRALFCNRTLQEIPLTDEFADAVAENGMLVDCHGGCQDVCGRNRNMHDHVRQVVIVLLANKRFRKGTCFDPIPKEVVLLVAQMVWKTRGSLETWCF